MKSNRPAFQCSRYVQKAMRRAVYCVPLLLALQARAENLPLVGIAQVSRGDGLVIMLLAGSYNEKAACARTLDTFVSYFLENARAAGHAGQADFAACVDRVPRETEFEALRHGTPTSHYIFFTPSLRLMNIHPRGTLEYERQLCEFMRGQLLSKLKIEGQCYAPKG